VVGVISLPDDAFVPEGAMWSVELQDTSLADVPAVVLGIDGGPVEDVSATEISFAIAYDPATIDERATYTLSAKIFDPEGDLLLINDTSTPGFLEGEPVEELTVEVDSVAADATAEASAVAEASPSS
jgi:uncharacterized lipoprotein YbaY